MESDFTVLSVENHDGLISRTFITRVSLATNYLLTISEQLTQSPLKLNSVRYAMYRLPLEEVESFSTKCPNEKKVTEHEYTKVMPVADHDEDPMTLLKLTKRLVLCTECGTLRLIN
jgi:hypothetical protein